MFNSGLFANQSINFFNFSLMNTENKKPSNPLVFPVVGAKNKVDNYGMTLRDYFADSASKVIPIKEQNRGFRVDKDYDNWAKECYKRADAMLKQREL